MLFLLTLSLSLVARCQSGDSDLEKVGGTNVVPFLFDERMKAKDKKEE
jgi:hypothetical protein